MDDDAPPRSGSDDALEATSPSDARPARPSPADILALLAFPAEGAVREHREQALSFLEQMGVLASWAIDEQTGIAAFELSDAYLRLTEAGRDPDLEPGFDAAWDAGGPAGVREWLREQAEAL